MNYSLAAQPGNYYHIQGYSAIDGFKPYQAVSYITEDNQGLIWIGTDNGLYNFDGRFFKTFTHKSADTLSIPSNLVMYNYQDRRGRYWVYVAVKGLYNYNPVNGAFKKFAASNPAAFNINNYQLSRPFEDSKGNLWFGALTYGLIRYNPADNSITPYPVCFPGNCAGFRTSSWISKFYEDPEDNSLWLVTNKGLVHFFPSTGHSEIMYDNAFNNKLTDGSAIFTAICPDHKNNIWLGTWGQGIKKYNRQKKNFETYLPFPGLINGTRNICDGIAVRDSNSLWVSCIDQGLLIFNMTTRQFTKVYQVSQFTSFKNCQSLYQSQNGTLWFCSDKKLYKLNPAENLFSFSPFSVENSTQDEQGDLHCFITANGSLYAGMYYNGSFYKYNRQRGKYDSYSLPGGIKRYDVADLEKDAQGNIWMATTAGTYIFNPVSDRIFSPPVTSGNKAVFSFSSRSISFDKLNNTWIATRNGLVKYNQVNKNAVLFSKTDTFYYQLPGNNIYTVFCDSKDNVWVGLNEFGLGCLKKGDSNFIFFNSSRNKAYLQSNCTSIAEGKNGEIYYALDNLGLFILKQKFTSSETITTVNAEHGLPTDYVNSVITDKKKRIWVYSSAGISILDPGNLSCITFTRKEGLMDCEYSGRPFLDENDNLYVGGKNGFQVFNTDSILKKHTVTSKIHFSDFRVNGKPYQKEPVNIDDGHGILLEPGENNLVFQFAALSTSFSNQVRYAYFLKGYDKDWIETEKNNVTYSNLPPGRYELRIRTGYFTNTWNKDYFTLPITIKNPWYRQWWFLLLCFSAVTGLLYAWYRYRVRNLRAQLKLKTAYDKKISEIEMKALRAQMNPHFIFNCLNSINRYIVKSDEKTASSYLTRFSKLIRLILDNSSSETIPLEKEIETLKLYIEMEALRFDHVFDYTVEVDQEINSTQDEIPTMLIQPYVENAIWHGLLHKDEGRGLLQIKFSSRPVGFITVSIKDNGIGREKAAEQKSKDALKRKSYGMQITNDRIMLINNFFKINATVEIIDLKNELGAAAGTEVLIQVPVKQ